MGTDPKRLLEAYQDKTKFQLCQEIAVLTNQLTRWEQTAREAHRDVILIWEIDPINKSQCLRSIDECEENAIAHLKMFRSEALSANRTGAKFFKEKAITNHAFGFQEMSAARIVLSAITDKRINNGQT